MPEISLELGDEDPIVITLSDGGSLGMHIIEVLSSPQVSAMLDEKTGNCGGSCYSDDGDGRFPEEWAAELLDAFLESGSIDAVSDLVISKTDEFHYFRQVYKHEVLGQVEELAEDIAAALGELHRDVRRNEVRDEVGEALKDACVDLLREQDKTSPLDSIPGYARVEVAYVPGLAEAGELDGLLIQPVGVYNTGLVMPGEGLVQLLRLANVSSADLKQELRGRGYDPDKVPAESDYEVGKTAFMSADIRIQALWSELQVEADPERPSLCSAAKIVEILENGTSSAAVPVLAMRVGLKEFITQPWNDGGTIEISGKGPRGAPMIGIHDFWNGAGYIDTYDCGGGLTLPAVSANWISSSHKRYGFDNVYGLVMSYLDVGVVHHSVPELAETDAPAP